MNSGLRYEAEVPVPVISRGLTIPTAYLMDLLVAEVVSVETKARSDSADEPLDY